jgi:hypothetical protein
VIIEGHKTNGHTYGHCARLAYLGQSGSKISKFLYLMLTIKTIMTAMKRTEVGRWGCC